MAPPDEFPPFARRCRGRDRALAAPSRRRTAHVGEDASRPTGATSAQFLGFLAEHLGGAPHAHGLPRIAPRDVRAFMAARRADGIGSRSLMRRLAGARSFARFLERNGKGKVGALAAVRAPKLPRRLPKPLGFARRSDHRCRLARRRGARTVGAARDAAVLALSTAPGCASLRRSDLRRSRAERPATFLKAGDHRPRCARPLGRGCPG